MQLSSRRRTHKQRNRSIVGIVSGTISQNKHPIATQQLNQFKQSKPPEYPSNRNAAAAQSCDVGTSTHKHAVRTLGFAKSPIRNAAIITKKDTRSLPDGHVSAPTAVAPHASEYVPAALPAAHVLLCEKRVQNGQGRCENKRAPHVGTPSIPTQTAHAGKAPRLKRHHRQCQEHME